MSVLEVGLDDQVVDIPLASNANCLVLAVWGSSGSGKTTLAVNLAFEFAQLGSRTLLVDADSYRPSCAALLDLTDSGPGITAVTRLGRQGRLTLEELLRLSTQVKFGRHSLEVLTGISAPSRWPELDNAGLAALLALGREQFDVMIFDLSGELADGLSAPGAEHDRNFATRYLLSKATNVVGVFAAEPVGLNRFLYDLRELDIDYWPIANRVSSSNVGKHPEKQISESFLSLAKTLPKAFLPQDHQGCDWMLLTGKPLILQPRQSRLSSAIHALALELLDSHHEQ